MTDAPYNPSDEAKGILTINGSSAGRQYSAEVYSYSGTKDKLTYGEYIGWTALGAQLAAGARAASPDAIRLVSLTGDAFSAAGQYLVAVNEYLGGAASGTRYQTAAAFDANGRASVNWAVMEIAPSLYEEEPPAAGVLTITGAAEGAAYRAEVFNYSEGGRLDYTAYVNLDGKRAAAGDGAAPSIALRLTLTSLRGAASFYCTNSRRRVIWARPIT
jgi:hypothetical protein